MIKKYITTIIVAARDEHEKNIIKVQKEENIAIVRDEQD